MRNPLITLALLTLFISGCERAYTPKPKAYVRIELPEKNYLFTEGDAWTCPYTFSYSESAFITIDPRYKNKDCWFNVYYPKYRATLHLTYFALQSDLARHIEESRGLAMKHISKASQIDEILIEREQDKVYGVAYDFEGETASDMQFFLTDSTSHFLRGALYFNVHPNKDSLAPVITYIEDDVRHLIETLSWVEE